MLANLLKVAEKIEKYHIHTLHTCDKKGFATGICCTVKRIIEIHQLRTEKSVSSNHDVSHELISLLAYICTDRARTTSAEQASSRRDQETIKIPRRYRQESPILTGEG